MLSFRFLEWIVLGCTCDELSIYKYMLDINMLKHKLVTKILALIHHVVYARVDAEVEA